MWAFILTEVLTFAGLFVAYIVFRSWYPDMFVGAHKLLDVNKGLMNTIVLITSSLTMALAIWAIQKNNRKLSLIMLIAITDVIKNFFILITSYLKIISNITK